MKSSSNLSNSMNLSSPLQHFREKNDGKGPVSMLSMMQDNNLSNQLEAEKVQAMEEEAKSRLIKLDPSENTKEGDCNCLQFTFYYALF